MIGDQIKITDIGSHIQVSWEDAVITTHRKRAGTMIRLKEQIEKFILSDVPEPLQYPLEFNDLVIAFAKRRGYVAREHNDSSGWWRFRKLDAQDGTWNNMPLPAMLSMITAVNMMDLAG